MSGWEIRIRSRAGAICGGGVLITGRYAITAAHVVARALGADPADDRPAGRVAFDLPLHPKAGIRYAEIVRWSPAGPSGTDLAGLSVVGPPMGDLDDPVLRRIEQLGQQRRPGAPRTVRVRGFPPGDHASGVTTYARLTSRAGVRGEWIQLNRVRSVDPFIDHGFSGAGVVHEDSGDLLGIVLARGRPGDQQVAYMSPVETIAASWPLVNGILNLPGRGVASKAHDLVGRLAGRIRGGERPHPLRREHLFDLVERCLDVPEMADSQSRHTIVSELPLDVSMTAPRSANDRADIAAVLWACAQSPPAFTRLRIRLLEAGEHAQDRQSTALRALTKELGDLAQ